MKMTYPLCTIVLAVICMAANAQQFKTNVSEKVKFMATPELMMVNDGYIKLEEKTGKAQLAFTFKLNRVKHGIRLLKYNKGMAEIKSLELSNGENVYGPLPSTLRMVNDKVYLFYYELTGVDDASQMRLLATEINAATLQPGKPMEILTVNQKNVGLFKSMDLFNRYAMLIQQSPDKSKTALVWASGLNDDMFISVLDKDFRLIRQQTESLRFEGRLELNGLAVDNTGNVYIGYKRPGDEYFEARLLVNDINNKSTDKPVKLTEGHPYQVQLTASAKDNAVFITGLYTESISLKGVFIIPVKWGTAIQEKAQQIPFPDSLVERFDKDGWASTKKKKFGIDPIWMQAALLEDGAISMVGEFRASERSDRFTTAFSGDLLVIHIKGGKAVFARVPKYRQSVASTIGDSYYFFPYKDRTILFYADSENNLKENLDSKPASSSNTSRNVLVAAVINASGQMKREMVLDLREDNFLPVSEWSKQASASKLMIPFQRIRSLGRPDDDFRWATVDILP